MKRILQLALLLLPMTALAQPPVAVFGPVGSKGSGFPTIFPVTITLPSDADYTMAYPDMSGSSGLLQIDCAVSLSTQRNVIAQTISGFWWLVENNCNQAVYVKESTGAGVQILSGYAQIVGCDLTHCFTPPQGSGGTVLSVAGTPPVSCTGGANVTCLMAQANSTTDGYLSHIDWAAFYAKQNALGFTPAHSGANSDISSILGLTTPLSSTQGGSGTAGGTGYRYGNGASPDSYSLTIPCASVVGASCTGYNPTLHAVTSLRNIGTMYHNTNGVPMTVVVTAHWGSSNTLYAYAGIVLCITEQLCVADQSSVGTSGNMTFIVPIGVYYEIEGAEDAVLDLWNEWY